ncbi:rCG54990 [Rattus norvegicus]|uniref:RCG54990 n=1 Tax=Rattus norvegicus TaxID=10116 RepID=A6IJ99_RAT|nr:rCG54990 [Rattus norvegicus]
MSMEFFVVVVVFFFFFFFFRRLEKAIELQRCQPRYV